MFEHSPLTLNLGDVVGLEHRSIKAPCQPVPVHFQQGCLLFVYLEGIAVLQG